jgi:hypothetical protein
MVTLCFTDRIYNLNTKKGICYIYYNNKVNIIDDFVLLQNEFNKE